MFTFCLIQYHLPHSTSTHRKEKNVGLPLVNVIFLNSATDPLRHVKKTFVQDGHPCGENQWLCVSGICVSSTTQCPDTFGESIYYNLIFHMCIFFPGH